MKAAILTISRIVVASTALISTTCTSQTLTNWGDNLDGQLRYPAAATNAVVVAAGAFHSAALDTNGWPVVWGKNSDGQTNAPASASNLVAIAVGGDHTLGLTQQGNVLAWGRNWDGQTDVPATATNVVSVAAGWAHSLALRADGTVLAWGNNNCGQTSVSFLANNVVAIAAGYYHSLALRSDGLVVGWGGFHSVPPSATNAVAVAAGWGHSLALLSNGRVLAWGDNSYGQTNVPAAATNVVAIAAGYGQSWALRHDGVLLGWGTTNYGLRIVPSGLRNVSGIAAGENHVVVLVESGPLRFLRQPVPARVHVGGSAVFDAEVAGTGPLTAQWYRNGAPIPGATNRLLTLANVNLTDAGNYEFQVQNAFSTNTSIPANLNVLASPQVKTPANYQNALPQEPFVVFAEVLGSQPMGYRWRLNGQPLTNDGRISGASSPQLAISTLQFADAGDYSLVASNAAGSVTGLVTHLSVTPITAWGDDSCGQLKVPVRATNVVAVSAGENHNLALLADGTALGWGDNTFGQADVPTQATNLAAVSAGGAHNLALTTDGRVIAWGDNSSGQTDVPPRGATAVAIAAGGQHSLALLADGTVVAWGNNSCEQTNAPVSATNVVAIAAGDSFSLALQGDGTLLSWGSVINTDQIVAIAAGSGFRLARRSNGAVMGWGNNYFGQATVPTPALGATAIAAGGHHSLALMQGGQVLAWGANYSGQAQVPSGVTGITSVSAGGAHSIALSGVGTPFIIGLPRTVSVHSGRTFVFGGLLSGAWPLTCQWLHNGQPIAGATNAFLIQTNASWADRGVYELIVTDGEGHTASQQVTLNAHPEPFFVTPGAERTVLVTTPFSLPAVVWGEEPMSYQWSLNGTNLLNDERISGTDSAGLQVAAARYADMGEYDLSVSNAYGQASQAMSRVFVTPVAAWGSNSSGQTNVSPAATNVVAITAGYYSSLALRADGTVTTWGSSSSGISSIPTSVTNIIAIAAGDYHALALCADGTVAAWGSNTYGQTNIPSTATNVVAIDAGGDHCLALRTDGSIIGWGDNFWGQTAVPASATSVVAVAAGDTHSMALRADGTVVAWGSILNSHTTIPASATNIVAIAASRGLSLALRTDGTAVAWGSTLYGATTVPPSATNVVAITAGEYHGLALRADGSLVAWGRNTSGQTNVIPFATNATAIAAGANHSLALVSTDWELPTLQLFKRQATLDEPAAFTAITLGSGPASYQWQFNGNDLPGATSRALLIPSVHWTNAGTYQVIASNVFGTVPGPPMTLTVQRMPLRLDASSDGLGLTPAGLKLRVLGAAGLSPVVVYATTNLQQWEPVYTNAPVIGAFDVIDAGITNRPHTFYRASELESP